MSSGDGVNFEWSIVYHAQLQNGQIDPTVSDPKLRSYGNPVDSWAISAVEHASKVIKGKFQAYHSDNWKGRSISGNPEPKTDIVFEKNNRPFFTSVKMSKGVQLASGEGKSTAMMFEKVIDSMGIQSRVLKDIVAQLKVLPSRLLSERNFDRIMEEGKPKIVEEFVKNGRIKKDKSYELWVKNNKEQLMSSLFAYLKKNPEFKFALIREAMTGKLMFGNSPATATHIITPNHFGPIDDAYINEVMKKVKIDIRAKSRGGISSLAFRIETTT